MQQAGSLLGTAHYPALLLPSVISHTPALDALTHSPASFSLPRRLHFAPLRSVSLLRVREHSEEFSRNSRNLFRKEINTVAAERTANFDDYLNEYEEQLEEEKMHNVHFHSDIYFPSSVLFVKQPQPFPTPNQKEIDSSSSANTLFSSKNTEAISPHLSPSSHPSSSNCSSSLKSTQRISTQETSLPTDGVLDSASEDSMEDAHIPQELDTSDTQGNEDTEKEQQERQIEQSIYPSYSNKQQQISTDTQHTPQNTEFSHTLRSGKQTNSQNNTPHIISRRASRRTQIRK